MIAKSIPFVAIATAIWFYKFIPRPPLIVMLAGLTAAFAVLLILEVYASRLALSAVRLFGTGLMTEIDRTASFGAHMPTDFLPPPKLKDQASG